jgi:[ribosomal protein S5]-alanine N-acetyltransferase
MRFETITGICLTEFRHSDTKVLAECLGDQDIYERTLRIPHPYTAADAKRWLAIVEKATKQNRQPVNWAIREDAGRVIGGIGLDGLVIGQSHRAEIGYWLAKPFWGRGIMPAAVQAVCRHAFENLGLTKITAHVFSFNAASQRVLEKCGFEHQGHLRKHFLKDGRYIDAELYELVRDKASSNT